MASYGTGRFHAQNIDSGKASAWTTSRAFADISLASRLSYASAAGTAIDVRAGHFPGHHQYHCGNSSSHVLVVAYSRLLSTARPETTCDSRIAEI